MVILQFNKLIRNKWVWGVFAIAVSAAFCFDDMFTSRDKEERQSGDAGALAGKSVKAADFLSIAEDVRGFGQQRDWKRSDAEVNREAWENYAALSVAEKIGVTATDAEVRQAILRDSSFQNEGSFSFPMYQALLRQNGLSPERFELYLKRRMTIGRMANALAGSAVWTPSAVVDRSVYDVTDRFTVKVARFSQAKADADKVTVDEAGVRKWYDENSKSLELPARTKIRYVRFNAADTNVLARMTVSEDSMRDFYDSADEGRYTKTVTNSNGTETVKMTYDEAKPAIEKEMRQIAAVECFETNLSARIYGVKAADGKSRLDEIAAEERLAVSTSPWFSLEGGYQEGFMTYYGSVLPGASEFVEKVSELDSSSEDLRYGIVSSKTAVWLVERFEESPAHTPTFDEAKSIIRPRALRAAKADAFKAQVEAVIAKGRDAVLASGNVSTNITFTIADMSRNEFPDANVVVGAARKLAKGEISEFTLTSPGKAVVVVCEDRQEGAADKVISARQSLRAQLAMMQAGSIAESWQKWNLERLGFEPGEVSSVTQAENED